MPHVNGACTISIPHRSSAWCERWAAACRVCVLSVANRGHWNRPTRLGISSEPVRSVVGKTVDLVLTLAAEVLAGAADKGLSND